MLAATLGACTGSPAATSASTEPCDNSGFLATEHAHANHAEVTFCGTVTRVRELRRTRSGVHRIFTVDIDGGVRIEIDANVDEMGDFPIHPGEAATIRGEYYYDDDGREGVHWTHHTDHGPHPPGFVILDGTRYE
jgi:hypothetical protein